MIFQILLGIFLCAMSHGAPIEPSNEGDCSRFVYEYKLMERLVSLELDKTAMYNKIAYLEETRCADTKTTVPSPPNTSPLIAVKIGLSVPKKVTTGSTIIYDRVVANEGDVYDTKTGIFEAPVSGVYSFVVSLCLNHPHWMVLTLVRNRSDLIIGQFLGGDNAYHTCTNDYSTVKLDIGDKVWVEKISGNTDDLNEEYGWNSFSGNLIQPA